MENFHQLQTVTSSTPFLHQSAPQEAKRLTIPEMLEYDFLGSHLCRHTHMHTYTHTHTPLLPP